MIAHEPYGAVLTENQLRRHRNRAGYTITNRQKGQKHHGRATRIEWSADKVVLPTITGSKASGVVISCSGMKGSDIRGQNHARADGQVVRPQLVMVDDPQTTESAWSPSQSQRREAILAGDVLGMAGPGKKIAGLMACTVIRPADMADNILDRDKHPEWQGEPCSTRVETVGFAWWRGRLVQIPVTW